MNVYRERERERERDYFLLLHEYRENQIINKPTSLYFKLKLT